MRVTVGPSGAGGDGGAAEAAGAVRVPAVTVMAASSASISRRVGAGIRGRGCATGMSCSLFGVWSDRTERPTDHSMVRRRDTSNERCSDASANIVPCRKHNHELH
ncbi:hypothetical protein Misp05_41690 [Micromonospora sp. NBRC 107095]|nr:hypothetical protein Misp05_41690 [Micromonospora sp. NBRC 107095]